MDRDRLQLWIAATCALAVHAALFATGDAMHRRGWGVGKVIADPKSLVSHAPPLVAMRPPIDPDRNELGELTGQGDAISSIDHAEPATADHPEPFNQAWTRQKPMPLPTRSAQAEKARKTSETTDAARDPAALGPMSVIGKSALVSAAPAVDAKLPNDPAAEQRSSDPAEDAHAKSEAADSPSARPPASAEANPAAEPDPALKGPSDLDAFAKEEGVRFTGGGMEARGGREVKLKRPHIDLAFMADATRLPGDEFGTKLLVETDSTGHPTRVDVIATSHSAIIDDALRLAAYDSWFGGKMPDRFPFTIVFLKR